MTENMDFAKRSSIMVTFSRESFRMASPRAKGFSNEATSPTEANSLMDSDTGTAFGKIWRIAMTGSGNSERSMA